MDWRFALRDKELSQEECKDKVCVCIQIGDVDQYGEGSGLPCNYFDPDNYLTCSKCIYYNTRRQGDYIFKLRNGYFD